MAETKRSNEQEAELPQHWKAVQGAIWMIGIAVLAVTGWWWPGIMIVVAISMLAEAGIRLYIRNQVDREESAAADIALEAQRHEVLPDTCPSCGSPATVENVDWTGPLSAKCTFCGNTLTASNRDVT